MSRGPGLRDRVLFLSQLCQLGVLAPSHRANDHRQTPDNKGEGANQPEVTDLKSPPAQCFEEEGDAESQVDQPGEQSSNVHFHLVTSIAPAVTSITIDSRTSAVSYDSLL